MKNAYTNFGGTQKTPQSKPIPGSAQVKNDAGGYTYKIDKWAGLERFLILGTEGGTYYVQEAQLTERNANTVIACVKEDGKRVVEMIVDISEAGRAIKNDPALFALAICTSKVADVETRKLALLALPKVARIFTHLSHFLTYVQQFRGWGRGLREAVASWYNDKPASKLAYQMVKYRQRDGWTQGDVLKKAHPKPATKDHDWLYGWALDKRDDSTLVEVAGHEIAGQEANHPLRIIGGFTAVQKAETVEEALPIIRGHGLTREMIPTKFLKSPEVWGALWNEGKMPMHALIRNLGNMSACGFIDESNFDLMQDISSVISSPEKIIFSRLHPMAILTALKVYATGQSGYGHNTWSVAQPIVNALDDAFYLAFDNIEPTGKRILLACDVSGSMRSSISGNQHISCAEGVGALALITARVEKNTLIRGFTAGSKGYVYSHHGGEMDGFIDLGIDPRQRLDDAIAKVSGLNFGSTDCALPAMWALENKVELDAFVVLTDNETWAGSIHPSQAMEQYRREINPDAKLIVVSMTASQFSIADPEDAKSLDVVGFDTSTPSAIADFIR